MLKYFYNQMTGSYIGNININTVEQLSIFCPFLYHKQYDAFQVKFFCEHTNVL